MKAFSLNGQWRGHTLLLNVSQALERVHQGVEALPPSDHKTALQSRLGHLEHDADALSQLLHDQDRLVRSTLVALLTIRASARAHGIVDIAIRDFEALGKDFVAQISAAIKDRQR